MPRSMREALAALIGLEVLIEGVFFDSHDLRKLPFRPSHITRVLSALLNSGVLERVNTRKYVFTDEFLGLLKKEVLGKMPRSGIIQLPATTVFDACGIESWSEHELEQFVEGLRKHWLDLSGRQGDMLKC